MKNLRTTVALILAIIFCGSVGFSQQKAQAKLQVIHNAADVNAAVVDIYINGVKEIDDFAFRTATPFLTLPSNTNINIGVAPGNSGSFADTLTSFNVTLEAKNYVAVANGVLSPNDYQANPDSRNTAFGLIIKEDARVASSTSGSVEFSILHGSTDAPTVDITARNVATLANNAAYTDFTDYTPVPAARYLLDITDATGTVNVATFEADLSSLADSALTVFASGFLSPDDDQNGAAFGIFAALANGTVVELPVVNTARLQVIHNAADPAAAVVDIYLGENRLIDNFEFRKATAFIDAPAGTEIIVGVAGGNSSTVADTLTSFALTLMPGESYIAFANGVLDPSAFEANPDGRSTGFGLIIDAKAQESAKASGNTDLIVLHGSTDAPTVDVYARDVAQLVDNAAYSDIARGEDYISVPSADYILDVTDASGQVVVASYAAPLSALPDSAVAVFASGFFSPDNDQNGEAFGIFAALPNGNVIELPLLDSARLQVIHNAADPAAAVVDIYLNGDILLDDFAFRDATPFIDAPALTALNIGVAPGNSGSVADTLTSFNVKLLGGATYTAVANGVLAPASFATNPDGRSTAFTLFINDRARETSENSGEVDFSVIHGSTDAPTVDVVARNVAQLVDNAAYGDQTDYISVPANSYILDITNASGTTKVAKFDAPLTGFADSALTVLASGFFTPANNQNGEAFAVIAVTPSGKVISLPVITSIESIEENVINKFSLEQNYPNPFNPSTTIQFSIPATESVTLKIYDISGQLVSTLVDGQQAAGSYKVTFDATQLASGLYFYQINAGGFTATKRMVLLK